MLFSKNNLLVAELAEKYGPVGGVFFSKDKTVATNRVSLVEVSAIKPDGEQIKGAMKGFKPFVVSGADVKNITTSKLFPYVGVKHADDKKIIFIDRDGNETTLARQQEKFPEYDMLFKNSGKAEFTIDAGKLVQLLKIMEKVDNKIKIKVGKDTEPLILSCAGSGQTARALIMPIKE